MTARLHGLVAATHTPFDAEGRLNLSVVGEQAAHLHRNGVRAVFVGGTTGESHSLTVAERSALANEWANVVKSSPLRIVLHVGANCLADACMLAEQARQLGVSAIAAVAPSYFKPQTLDTLIECCRTIAAAAPSVPFYYYDIPSFTGLRFSMPDFLDAAADRIPTLAGIKFSNPDLMAYQRCLRSHDGRFDVPWGIDECLLAALTLGGQGGVGSSYNFASAIYLRMIDAFKNGDLAAAREEQYRSVRLIQLLSDFGYLAASRAVMEMLGVPLGPPRLPNGLLEPSRHEELRTALEQMGFFDWI
jgi:N-acetylneuraminate lyase